jgi:peptide/nickel transport system ATP-binding protein
MRKVRGRQIGMIFQDPLTSLNPLYRISDQLIETIQAHLPMSESEARKRAISLLDDVGIPAASRRIDDYPHQLSGGMRQRVVIALALAADPEARSSPTSPPPRSTSRSRRRSSAHDPQPVRRARHRHSCSSPTTWGVIAEITDRVAVMYAGRIAEIGPVREV